MKNFFIPHEGNNYQPKSLHPKRLLFHTGGALLVKLLVFVLVSVYPISAWVTPSVSSAEIVKIVTLTNDLRRSLALKPLNVSTKLNQAAMKKVEDMFINQYFAHVSPQNFDLEHFLKSASYTDYFTVGENLAMGYDNAQEVVTAWKNSPTHYSNLVDSNFQEIGVGLTGGIYNEKDTVFIAQYFGMPKNVVKPELIKKEEKSKKVQVKSASSARVVVNEASGFKNDKVVRVEANLPMDTKTAKLEIMNSTIEMMPSANNDQEKKDNEEITYQKWSGQAVIDEENESITPPIISLDTNNGEKQKLEISYNDISPQKTSIAKQYWLFKNMPDANLKPIFDISSIYFLLILVIAFISLLFNVFIKIERQHPRLIFSGLGFIMLLIILIII